MIEANGVIGAIIGRTRKTADNSTPCLDMGEVIGAKHGLNDGNGVKGMTRFDGGDGEQAKRVGIKAVKLAFMAEAGDDGLGAGERLRGVLVGELRD